MVRSENSLFKKKLWSFRRLLKTQHIEAVYHYLIIDL